MDEIQFRELVKRGDMYVRVGTAFRLINLDTDTSGALIDIGHNLYVRMPDGKYQPFATGGATKGDIEMPPEAANLPDPDEKPKGQYEQVGKVAGAVGKGGLGCLGVTVGIGIGLPLIIFAVGMPLIFISRNPIVAVVGVVLALIFWPRKRGK